MTADARTIPARGSIAALLVLADRALTGHRTAHGTVPTLRLHRSQERAAITARRDALADAYRCVVADELGVQFMVLDLPQLLDHARQTGAAVGAL